jgi:co-chaperonin GroES (HSP10)
MLAKKEFNFIPLHGFVVAKEIPRTETHGGLALPDNLSRDDEPSRARVVAVGPGEETDHGRREMPVDVGDEILIYFPAHAMPAELNLDGERYLICQAKFICGKFRK